MTYNYKQVNHNVKWGSGIIESVVFSEAVCGGLFIIGIGAILAVCVALQRVVG